MLFIAGTSELSLSLHAFKNKVTPTLDVNVRLQFISGVLSATCTLEFTHQSLNTYAAPLNRMLRAAPRCCHVHMCLNTK